MSSYVPQDPKEYKLYQVGLLSDRIQHRVDITKALVGLNIYEHLEKPYLTGNLTFADTSRVLEIADFKGTERIQVKLGLHQSTEIITKTFIIRRIQNVIPSTDTADVITVDLIEYDGFTGLLQLLNKAYEGKPGFIISDMLRDTYTPGKKLKENSVRDRELQAAFRYITPNVNVFEGIEFVKTRATGLTGTPFFCYAALADNDLRFYDLFDLIRSASVNRNSPFVYSSYITQNANINVDKSRIAFEMTTTSSDNTLEMLLAGNLGATYEFVDPTHALEYNFNFDMDKVFQNILGDGAHPVADTRTFFGTKRLSEYQTKRVNLMAPSLLYYDQKNPYEEYNTAAHSAKAVQKSIRGLLGQEMITIGVPGLHTMPQGGNKTIGRIITFVSLGDMEQAPSEPLDRRRSGDYLIYAAVHSFSQEQYMCKMDLVKLSNFKGNTKVYSNPPVMNVNPGAGPQ